MMKLDERYEQASSQNLPKVDLTMLVSCLASYQQSVELQGVKTSRYIKCFCKSIN